MAWHRRLRQQGVYVPGILANADGQLATLVTDGQAEPGTRVCVVFDWVAGRSLRSRLTARRSAALGRLSARLHREAVAWPPPRAGDVLIADRVLYWQLPERLSAAGARFGFGTLFADALARAQRAVDSLWRSPPNPPHLLHGDLTPANVILSPRHGLVPIDFQDTVLGFEVQDLAITVAALRRRPDGERLIASFRSGYGECRPWPDVSPALFESLIIARGLHQMNLTLNIAGTDGLEGYIAGHADRVRAWMRSRADLPASGFTPADREDKLAAVALSALLTVGAAAGGREPALLGDPDRGEIARVDFEQELAKPEVSEGPVDGQPHGAGRHALAPVPGKDRVGDRRHLIIAELHVDQADRLVSGPVRDQERSRAPAAEGFRYPRHARGPGLVIDRRVGEPAPGLGVVARGGDRVQVGNAPVPEADRAVGQGDSRRLDCPHALHYSLTGLAPADRPGAGRRATQRPVPLAWKARERPLAAPA
jgi:Ser/Thr protein kinase RdoA (MazF antagonist)